MKVLVPAVVGVPVKSPVAALRVNPAGSVPTLTVLHVPAPKAPNW